MTEKYVCTTCGSETVNRRIEESSRGGVTEYIELPAYCGNRSCENADPVNHAYQWARIAE